jgi:hypothetical protein
MDANLLAAITGLSEEPQYQNAKAIGFGLKYWDQFPVLRRKKGSTVDGVLWYAPTPEIVERLRAYETDAYVDTVIRVKLLDGEEMVVHSFLWNRTELDLSDQPLE